jgi:alkylated DNA repair dioxygenase AlkB
VPAAKHPGDLLIAGPRGFRYDPAFVAVEEESALVAGLGAVAFSEIRMRGVAARRRSAHFGWLYGYETARIAPGPPLPEFLLPLRARAAALSDTAPERLEEVLITEYPAGAAIGWHRDAPMFDVVVGISLLAPCRMRFRRGAARDAPRWEAPLAPRSAYVLAGEVRWAWQHSIPPVESPRYSITFRTLSADAAATSRTSRIRNR